MSMLEIHAEALRSGSDAYHVFLQRYSKNSRLVYGVVEGYDDSSFYRPFVEALLPDDWEVCIINAKSKDNVYALHKDMDWRRFRKQRICFFVDRDLSDLIPEFRPVDYNIYVSRWYSIENELATPYAIRRLLTELSGFDAASVEDLDNLVTKFTQQSSIFYTHLIEVMTWALAARRSRAPANLNNVEMRRIFQVKKGEISVRPKPGGKASLDAYVEDRLGLIKPHQSELDAARKTLGHGKNREKFARGKYVIWFVFEYCNSVRTSAGELCSSIAKARAGSQNLAAKNGLPLAVGRARLPPCLRRFVLDNYVTFANR